MAALFVDINDQLLREFRSFAVAKNGKIYGVLKPEVEAALADHMKRKNPLQGKHDIER
jgi:hypothetical protein